MPKYLLTASYTATGAKGLLADGGTKRAEVATGVAEAVGGSVEALYFAFGGTDIYLVCDMPDNASAAAAALAVSASGAVEIQTTVLLTPAEIDAAAKKAPSYSPPGS